MTWDKRATNKRKAKLLFLCRLRLGRPDAHDDAAAHQVEEVFDSARDLLSCAIGRQCLHVRLHSATVHRNNRDNVRSAHDSYRRTWQNR